MAMREMRESESEAYTMITLKLGYIVVLDINSEQS